MRLIGIGIDIVETVRIKRSWEQFGESFLNRVFNGEEVAYAMSMKSPEMHLAARFAAKEAISKAFGSGIGEELGWKDMTILRSEDGKPYVRLSEKALSFAHRLGGDDVLVSLSHTENYAAAQAVLVGPELASAGRG